MAGGIALKLLDDDFIGFWATVLDCDVWEKMFFCYSAPFKWLILIKQFITTESLYTRMKWPIPGLFCGDK